MAPVNAPVAETVARGGELDDGEREGATAQKRRYMMPVKYGIWIEAIARSNVKVKPRHVCALMLSALDIFESTNPRDFPTQQKIARNVGAEKEKLKK